MIDERREAQASLYVLGALPMEEVHEFEDAIRSDLRLQLLVKELRGTAGAMVAAFPRVEPPPGLKQKILTAIDEQETGASNIVAFDNSRGLAWLGWVPWALAACFAILCVVLISLSHTLRKQAAALTRQIGERNEESAELLRQIDLLQAQTQQSTTNYEQRIVEVMKQATQRVEEMARQTATITNQLQQQLRDSKRQLATYRNQAEELAERNATLEAVVAGIQERLNASKIAILRPTAHGAANLIGASVWSPEDQRGLLVIENLAPLPATQSYQLWLIDPKNNPVSAGILPPSASTSVRVQFGTETKVENVTQFAVSIEPRGGMPTPTGKIVLVSN